MVGAISTLFEALNMAAYNLADKISFSHPKCPTKYLRVCENNEFMKNLKALSVQLQ
jgi:hypothetical protein